MRSHRHVTVRAFLLTTLSILMAQRMAASPGSSLSAGEDSSSLAYYVVFEVDDAGVPQPQFCQVVKLASPPMPGGEEKVDPEDADRFRVVLTGPGGDVVFREVAVVPRWIRGEFNESGPTGFLLQTGNHEPDDDGSPMAGTRVRVRNQAFIVRVPVVERARLSLHRERGTREANGVLSLAADDQDGEPEGVTFDLESLARDSRLPLARFALEAQVQSVSSSSANRLDLLVMGDGYTASQASKFETDAASSSTGSSASARIPSTAPL